MESLKTVFLRAGASENDSELLCTYFEHCRYKKDEYLLRSGSIATKIFFIETGCVILGSLTPTKAVTRHLATASEFVTSLESFHKQARTDEFLKATADCCVYEISKVTFDKAQEQFPIIQSFYQKIIFDLLVKCQQRITELTSLDAKSYYQQLQMSDPKLLQHMHQYDLASYMGIEPQSLSRLRTRKK